MPTKTRYLVLALSAGNIAMIGETREPLDPVGAVIQRAIKHAVPPTDLVGTAPEALQTPACLIHQLPMTLMHDRKGKPFWSCHMRMEDGRWCSYRPGVARPAASSQLRSSTQPLSSLSVDETTT